MNRKFFDFKNNAFHLRFLICILPEQMLIYHKEQKKECTFL